MQSVPLSTTAAADALILAEHPFSVLQLSMPTHDPGRLMDPGSRLKPLRQSGVLVIGSGFMTFPPEDLLGRN